MIDRDYLEQLRAEADEIREDLAERERLDELEDPIAAHERVMAATRVTLSTIDNVSRSTTAPAVVHKTNSEARIRQAYNAGDGDAPPFSDDQVDTLAEAIAQLRQEFNDLVDDALSPLRERIATLEGQLGMLMSVIGNGNKQFEASETIRKLRVS